MSLRRYFADQRDVHLLLAKRMEDRGPDHKLPDFSQLRNSYDARLRRPTCERRQHFLVDIGFVHFDAEWVANPLLEGEVLRKRRLPRSTSSDDQVYPLI